MDDPHSDLAALQSLSQSGYRWYADPACVRADDQLVRSLVSGLLCGAAAALRDEEGAARRALPAPSRQTPFPAAESTAHLAQLRHRHDHVLALDSRMRGAPSLPDRDFSHTHGVDPMLRQKLVQCDAALIGAAQAVSQAEAGPWHEKLAALQTAMDRRAATMSRAA